VRTSASIVVASGASCCSTPVTAACSPSSPSATVARSSAPSSRSSVEGLCRCPVLRDVVGQHLMKLTLEKMPAAQRTIAARVRCFFFCLECLPE